MAKHTLKILRCSTLCMKGLTAFQLSPQSKNWKPEFVISKFKDIFANYRVFFLLFLRFFEKCKEFERKFLLNGKFDVIVYFVS